MTPADLDVVHSGLLPVAEGGGLSEVSLLKRHRIVDHANEGVPGAISAISVKFTTARRVAEQVVDLAAKKLGRAFRPCVTDREPLPGTPGEGVEAFVTDANRRYGGTLEPEVIEHLVRSYGTELDQVVACRDSLPDWNRRPVPGAPVIRAQWLHAIRNEMACTAEDLVQRRTELGARGLVSDSVLAAASELLRDRGAAAVTR